MYIFMYVSLSLSLSLSIYIYIYIYTHICTQVFQDSSSWSSQSMCTHASDVYFQMVPYAISYYDILYYAITYVLWYNMFSEEMSTV